MKKLFLWLIVVSVIIVFSLLGCKAEEEVAEEEVAEEEVAEEEVAEEEVAEETTDITDTGEKKTLGAVMLDLVNPFFVMMMSAGNDAAEDFNVEVIWKSAEGSLENQVSLIENFIEQKVDCILLDPFDATGVIPVLEKAGEAGIPIITMGNFVDTKYNINTLYNDFNDTKRIAEIIANLIDKKGEVALIFGRDGNFASDQRKGGFLEGMAAFPDITVISQPSNWDSATGLKVAQDIIATNPDLKAIHVVSDSVTFSVMQATKGTDIILTSYDGSIEGSQAVKDGVFLLNLLTGAQRVGYWNVKVGAQLARGEKLDQKLYLSSYFIMNDDLKAKVEGWGLADDIKIVTPDEGIKLFDGYRLDMGPGK